MPVSFSDFVSIDELPIREAGGAKAARGSTLGPITRVTMAVLVPGGRSFVSWHPHFLVQVMDLLPAPSRR